MKFYLLQPRNYLLVLILVLLFSQPSQSQESVNPTTHYANICGRRFVANRGREGRIFGGKKSTYGDWPWQASLHKIEESRHRHICGGTLLTHEWIVTAGHCIKNASASDLLIRMGEHNILDRSEPYQHIDRNVRRIIMHEEFNQPIELDNDIALLQVDFIPFQPNIIPICLPPRHSKFLAKKGWATGWGETEIEVRITPVLREVQLSILSNKKCREMFRKSGQPQIIRRNFFCAGHATGGKDACIGDSGGPFTTMGSSDRFELAGIVSWGVGCAKPNQPGVYTRISEMQKWIREKINYEDGR